MLNGAQAQTPPAPESNADAAVRLQPIPVEGGGAGYQTLVPTLPKLSRPLLDTPQSINVVPRQLIEDQGITATRDALRTVPGISLAAGEAGAQGDNLTLRGFTARNDFFLDGMRDFGSYYRDPFNLEQIEVLKGPSSVLFGRGSTGGVVNQVSKQPGLLPVAAGSLGFGTDGTRRLTADVNRAIEGLDGAAIRLNLMVDQNGVAGRRETEYNRFGFAPSVAFGLGTPTRFTLSYLHQQEYDTPDYGLPWLYSKMAPVSRGTFYGFKDRDFLRAGVDMVTARLEHDVDDGIALRNQFRYGSYSRDLRITEPQIIYAGVTPA
jgi:catecholate siderophore receptor